MRFPVWVGITPPRLVGWGGVAAVAAVAVVVAHVPRTQLAAAVVGAAVDRHTVGVGRM